MAYKESGLNCDWCKSAIDDGESAACKDCIQNLEEKIKDLETENTSLKARLIALGEDI